MKVPSVLLHITSLLCLISLMQTQTVRLINLDDSTYQFKETLIYSSSRFENIFQVKYNPALLTETSFIYVLLESEDRNFQLGLKNNQVLGSKDRTRKIYSTGTGNTLIVLTSALFQRRPKYLIEANTFELELLNKQPESQQYLITIQIQSIPKL
jgi:hypothetical protein